MSKCYQYTGQSIIILFFFLDIGLMQLFEQPIVHLIKSLLIIILVQNNHLFFISPVAFLLFLELFLNYGTLFASILSFILSIGWLFPIRHSLNKSFPGIYHLLLLSSIIINAFLVPLVITPITSRHYIFLESVANIIIVSLMLQYNSKGSLDNRS